MEPIDAAFKTFQQVRLEIAEYRETIRSEEDTRLKVVNRVFGDVLGWPLADIQTEEPAGDGFIDYRLSIPSVIG